MDPNLRNHMRRTAAALAVPVIAAAVLAGCGSNSPSSASSANSSVTVSGAFGKPPSVQIPARKASANLHYQTEIHGSGPVVPSGDSVLGNFALYSWTGTTHKLLDSTFATVPQLLPAKLPLPGLQTALKGQTVGSRVLAVLPPKYAYGVHGNASIGISGTETLVWVVDLIKAFSPTAAASGTHVSNGGGKLPTVSAAATAPTVTIPKNTPPSKLVVKTLIKGSGAPLVNGQSVVAQVVGVNWRTKKTFYTTWPSATSVGAPFSFQLGGQVIPGWNKGLVGVPVGSRVMLIVPPSDGYGKAGQPSAGIKGTDTLVFVVDVLSAAGVTA
jgi:FKBP-type peptidyl-prolyl cis-trans isomerase